MLYMASNSVAKDVIAPEAAMTIKAQISPFERDGLWLRRLSRPPPMSA